MGKGCWSNKRKQRWRFVFWNNLVLSHFKFLWIDTYTSHRLSWSFLRSQGTFLSPLIFQHWANVLLEDSSWENLRDYHLYVIWQALCSCCLSSFNHDGSPQSITMTESTTLFALGTNLPDYPVALDDLLTQLSLFAGFWPTNYHFHLAVLHFSLQSSINSFLFLHSWWLIIIGNGCLIISSIIFRICRNIRYLLLSEKKYILLSETVFLLGIQSFLGYCLFATKYKIGEVTESWQHMVRGWLQDSCEICTFAALSNKSAWSNLVISNRALSMPLSFLTWLSLFFSFLTWLCCYFCHF